MSDPDAPPLNTRALLDAFAHHEVSFIAVGGLAAQWQGAQRHTKDMDVCPAWNPENLDRVAQALRDLGACLKITDSPAAFAIPLDSALLSRMDHNVAHRRRRPRHPARHPPRRPLGPRPL